MNKKTFFFSLIPFLYLILLLFRPDKSLLGDLGRQIKMGEIIVNCRCVPQINTFSFTYPTFEAINHSWLSEVVFYWLTKTFGLNSLLSLKFLLISTTFITVYLLALKRDKTFPSLILSMFSLIIFSQRFLVRPELFSYFFIAITLLIFELYKKHPKQLLLWLLPLLILIWTNMHIYFFIGVFISLTFIAEQIVVKKKPAKSFIILTCALILSPLINPNGMQGALYPLMVFHNYGAKVAENYPPLIYLMSDYPFFSQLVLHILLFQLLCGLTISGFFLFPKTKQVAEKLNSLLAIVLGQVLLRGTGLFLVLNLRFLVATYTLLSKKITSKFGKECLYAFNTILVLLLLLTMSIQIKSLTNEGELGFVYENTYENGVNFLIKNSLHGPIYNNFTTGNYLIYRLFPREKVFVDGRPEAYPAAFFQEYYKILADYSYFNRVAEKYSIGLVFYGLNDDLKYTRNFLLALSKDDRWSPVFWDGNVVIFVRNIPDNSHIIATNKNVKASLQEKLHKLRFYSP